MKEETRYLILDIGLQSFLAICWLALGAVLMIGYINGAFFKDKPLGQPLENTTCGGLDFLDTSYCLNRELTSFYNYNLTNWKIQLSEEELRTIGGVCWQYADWYKDKMLKLGYYADTFTFDLDTNTSHTIAIASMSDGYCLLDQRTIKCIRLESESSNKSRVEVNLQ